MSASAEIPAPPPKSRKGLLMGAALTLVAAGGGFASTYLGLWSPFALLTPSAAHAPELPAVVFVQVPPVQITLPGGRGRSVVLAATIETDAAGRPLVEQLMPRVLDSFTTFLSEIDPAAYDKRGVLEIIRAELVTRTRFVLGDGPVKDLLITEFRIQ